MTPQNRIQEEAERLNDTTIIMITGLRNLLELFNTSPDGLEPILNNIRQYGVMQFTSGATFRLSLANEWVGVETKPELDKDRAGFTVDVLLTDGIEYSVGYYCLSTDMWQHRLIRHPTHWARLLELPKK